MITSTQRKMKSTKKLIMKYTMETNKTTSREERFEKYRNKMFNGDFDLLIKDVNSLLDELLSEVGEDDDREVNLPDDMKWGTQRVSDLKFGRNEERNRVRAIINRKKQK